jgi:hypothetical protein
MINIILKDENQSTIIKTKEKNCDFLDKMYNELCILYPKIKFDLCYEFYVHEKYTETYYIINIRYEDKCTFNVIKDYIDISVCWHYYYMLKYL